MGAARENRRRVGGAYEKIAADFLTGQGVRILEANFRTRIGEIDLIASTEGTLVFVEVKYRKNERMGYPSEAVGYRKQCTICRVAEQYMQRKKVPPEQGVRFDVVEILGEKIRWIRDAFPYRPRK